MSRATYSAINCRTVPSRSRTTQSNEMHHALPTHQVPSPASMPSAVWTRVRAVHVPRLQRQAPVRSCCKADTMVRKPRTIIPPTHVLLTTTIKSRNGEPQLHQVHGVGEEAAHALRARRNSGVPPRPREHSLQGSLRRRDVLLFSHMHSAVLPVSRAYGPGICCPYQAHQPSKPSMRASSVLSAPLWPALFS